MAHFFGADAAADAWQAAFKIPNFLQNLFGEGALSASFIPVYAGLLARGEEREAQRLAGAVGALLGLVVAALVLAGMLAAPLLIDLIAFGFEGERRALAIRLVQIVFPGTGLLVLSAWCLGILNSHGRFFLSYAAPVVWNVAIIGALIVGPWQDTFALARVAAWGSVVGSALQLAVQLPAVLALTPGLRPALDRASAAVREVVRSFVPAFVGRGVAQISAYVDTVLASGLALGAVANLGYAQLLYTLPVSLFGMSVSAAELPAMARAQGDAEAVAAHLRERLARGLGQIAFFVVPSAAAFLALGHVIADGLYRSGRFTADDSLTVWAILAGSAIGLLAGTMARLYSSTFYALRDTRTPLRAALARVAVGTLLGYAAAYPLADALGIDPRWRVAGLTAASGLAAWLEYALLARLLARRIGAGGAPRAEIVRLWLAAAVGAAAGWAVLTLVPWPHPVPAAIGVLGTFGLAYGLSTFVMGVPQARAIAARLGLGGRRA